MDTASGWVVVGIDNGGTSNNATVLDGSGRFLVDRLVEMPSLVTEGETLGEARATFRGSGSEKRPEAADRLWGPSGVAASRSGRGR